MSEQLELTQQSQQANPNFSITTLNVAEKPSVAKAISEILCKSKQGPRKLETLSKYNPVFQFETRIGSQMRNMIVTSACGHIKEFRFPKKCKDWKNTNIKELFKVKLEKGVVERQADIVNNIQKYAQESEELYLWLDCDREGEAIAFDVIDLCKEVQPELRVKRCHFSALTKNDITNACTRKLSDPNKNLADAVFARQEIDLRIGASLTRLQSMNFKSALGVQQSQVVSYGPCQFPTLGFIVERYEKSMKFEPEKCWTIIVQYDKTKKEREEKIKNGEIVEDENEDKKDGEDEEGNEEAGGNNQEDVVMQDVENPENENTKQNNDIPNKDIENEENPETETLQQNSEQSKQPNKRKYFEPKKPKEAVQFEWCRSRLFDKDVCEILFERMMERPIATIVKISQTKKTKAKPFPMNTIDFQKLVSRKLRIGSHRAMEIAEKLYNKGYISYPRTETNIFPDMNLKQIVEELAENKSVGEYARKMLDMKNKLYGPPKRGKQDDKAHPPIHPVKCSDQRRLDRDEWRVYDIVCKHFLACLSKDAIGSQTKVEVDIGGEMFRCRGLSIVESNWLEVYYPYEKWADTIVPNFEEGDTFEPTLLEIQQSQTQAPKLLSEADLISRMDQTGIGTDATIHEHIKTVQERGYAVKEGQHFKPTQIGLHLVKAYEHVGIELYKPSLRAQMEKDLKLVAAGKKKKEEMLKECLKELKRIYKRINHSKEKMKDFLEEQQNDSQLTLQTSTTKESSSTQQTQKASSNQNDIALESYNIKAEDFFKTPDQMKITLTQRQIEEEDNDAPVFDEKTTLAFTNFMTCDKCGQSPIRVKMTNDGYLFAACIGFPRCKNAIHTLPKNIRNLEVTAESCQKCTKPENPDEEVKLFRITFYSHGIQSIKEICRSCEYKFCIVNKCDNNLLKIKQLSKGLKVAPKAGTFTDEITQEELMAKKENRQKWYQQKYGQFKKRDQKFDRKNQNGNNQQFNNKKRVSAGTGQRNGNGCRECGKMRHSAQSECSINQKRKQKKQYKSNGNTQTQQNNNNSYNNNYNEEEDDDIDIQE